MNRQYHTYEQCMANCKAAGGYSYECIPVCKQFPTQGHSFTGSYGMSQAVPYSPQSSSYPGMMYGNPYTYPRPRNPLDDPCIRRCVNSGGSLINCCYYCGWC